MAEDNKPAKTAEDDKSINDLLKEYADDVKDKDLDDFLKGSDEDAFESDSDDTDGDDTGGKSAMAEKPKKSGGFLTVVMMLVAFGAAGAGTYIYMNRDEGMTSIMGGFAGGNDNDAGMEMPPAPQPDAAQATPTVTPEAPQADVAMPAPAMDATTPAQPAPITNTVATPADETSMPSTQELMPAPTDAKAIAAPATDALAMPTPQMPEAPAATPAPVAATGEDAAKAVDAWASGVSDGMNNAVVPAPANTTATLPEQAVEEVKTTAPKAAKSTAASAQKAKAPKAATSPMDEALPPPYMAIQGKKTGVAPKAMAPVVEGSARNGNEADVTKATGDYRAMVTQGGGKIEIAGSKTTFVPAGSPEPTAQPQAAPVRETASSPMRMLAISGGKSVPSDGSDTAVMVPVPANDDTAPVAPAATVTPKTTTEVVMPKDAPVINKAAATSSQDAKAVLAQAVAMEKAGKTGDALELYQRALELDAVYADGKSIDRGMVYDRIGAIRAGSK